jgi:hypothetical protein
VDLVKQRWPTFSDELEAALIAAGEDALVAQVAGLAVVELCACRDDFCQSFATATPPAGAYGDGHSNLEFDAPWPGYLILDLVDDRIVFVEVLHREPLN